MTGARAGSISARRLSPSRISLSSRIKSIVSTSVFWHKEHVCARSSFRFSLCAQPNGLLHLGHALSALLNQQMAKACGGSLLLRIEDIDKTRCRPQLEEAIYVDLRWIGFEWQEPVRRQSEHFAAYQQALSQLQARGLIYPAFLTRGEVKARVEAAEAEGKSWPRDSDGAPHYPSVDRSRSEAEQIDLTKRHARFAYRLDMQKALGEIGKRLTWSETAMVQAA